MCLDYSLKQLVEELNVKLVYDMYLNAPAIYSPDFNIIVVSTKLTEYEQKLAILHELGHACLHKNKTYLYKITTTMREKMEYEANLFMLKKILFEYLNNPEIDLYSFNALQFLIQYNLNQNFLESIQNLYFEFLANKHL